jgi:hypothetical protein
MWGLRAARSNGLADAPMKIVQHARRKPPNQMIIMINNPIIIAPTVGFARYQTEIAGIDDMRQGKGKN